MQVKNAFASDEKYAEAGGNNVSREEVLNKCRYYLIHKYSGSIRY